MELCTCLQQHPWRTLKAIFRAYGLPFTPSPDKPSVCARLAAAILEPERLQATWHGLSPEAQAALRALSEADGQMRREVFISRFGSIRPYKPWRDDAPVAPWQNPASPAEELTYRGLVFALNQGRKRRPWWVVILPDEVKTALGPFLEVAEAVPSPPSAEPQDKVRSADIGEAVLAFLCFLNREDIRPLHGRWLPPNACRTLQGAMPLARAPHRPARVRSERQWPYLSFLHYLTERAGLGGHTAIPRAGRPVPA